jgi:membrane protease YdiL (CAAX protease family)
MLSVILFGAPQVLLILYILDLQPATTLGAFGVAPLAARDLLGLAAVFLGTFAVLSPLLILLLLFPAAGRELADSGYRWKLQSPVQLPLALAFSVVGAYREELFFRSYLLTRLGQLGVPAVWAVAASTALFALGHWYEGLLGLAVAGLLGIYFSVVFLRTRNLHTIALGHALYNFTVLCTSLLTSFALPENGKRTTF